MYMFTHSQYNPVTSYIVLGWVRPDRVLGSKGNAAHRDDRQDAELKILQSQDVVTALSKPGKYTQTYTGIYWHRNWHNINFFCKCIFELTNFSSLRNTHGFVVDMMKQELYGGIGLGPSSSPPSSSSSFFSSLFFWSVFAFLFTEQNKGRKRREKGQTDTKRSVSPEQDSKPETHLTALFFKSKIKWDTSVSE